MPLLCGIVSYDKKCNNNDVTDNCYVRIVQCYDIRDTSMGKVKAWKMDCEEQVYDMITEDMVNDCDHVTELYKKIDAQLPDYFPGDIITSVCDEMWNEYWTAKL